MIVQFNRILRHPEAASGASASQAGDFASASAAATDRLLQMMTPPDAAATSATNRSATAAAQATPETPVYSAENEDAGQNNLSAEEPTPGAADDATPNETSAETESQSDTENNAENGNGDGAGLPPEIAALPDGERSKLLTQLAEAIKNGESVNSLLRGHKYATKLEAQLEELTAKVEQLQGEESRGLRVESQPTALPETVAKLRTPAEVTARIQKVESEAEALQDFLDANPGDAGTVHQIGERQMTRQELINWRASLRAELKALPQRAQQIAQATEFQQKRKAVAQKVAADFPQVRDPENPDAVLARQLLSKPQFAGEVEAEYLALAMATGHRILQAQLAQKKNGTNGHAAANGTARGDARPTTNGNGIQKGKPAGAPSAAAPRSNGHTNGKALLERARRERSTDALAALIGGLE